MAGTITVSAQLKVENGKLEANRRLNSQQFTQNNQGLSYETQNIGTSEEALNISGDISTAGYAFFRNLDDTNFVSIRMGTGNPDVIKLDAGQFALVPLAAKDLYAVADTAAVELEFMVLED